MQPPNLVDDNDTLPPYIRCDVVIKEAMCWALRYKPKENPGYDPQTALAVANRFTRNFWRSRAMWNADENLYRTSSTIQGEDYPDFTPGGDIWCAATHAIMGDGASGLWG